MLTSNSLKSPYVKAVFRKLKSKNLAKVEKVSTNINLLCFDFMDFMNELCDVYDEVKLINNFIKKESKNV
jgi:hypothetical protein